MSNTTKLPLLPPPVAPPFLSRLFSFVISTPRIATTRCHRVQIPARPPTGVRRARRFRASSVPHVAAFASGSPRLHNGRVPTRSPPPSADLRSVPPPLTASLPSTAPDPVIQAAAAHLSSTLLNYSHHDWERAQREDPLCDATRRRIQLDCPKHPLASLCDYLPSHQRPDPADILDLAAKGRLIQGNHDTVLLVRKSTAAISRRFLPIGASIWYHYCDGSWWLGKLSNFQPPRTLRCTIP